MIFLFSHEILACKLLLLMLNKVILFILLLRPDFKNKTTQHGKSVNTDKWFYKSSDSHEAYNHSCSELDKMKYNEIQ